MQRSNDMHEVGGKAAKILIVNYYVWFHIEKKLNFLNKYYYQTF
jgi:hypothetical protein